MNSFIQAVSLLFFLFTCWLHCLSVHTLFVGIFRGYLCGHGLILSRRFLSKNLFLRIRQEISTIVVQSSHQGTAFFFFVTDLFCTVGPEVKILRFTSALRSKGIKSPTPPSPPRPLPPSPKSPPFFCFSSGGNLIHFNIFRYA